MMVERAKRVAERLQGSFPGRVVSRFIADDGPNQAVLIAWNSLLAMFPIVLALAAIGGFVLAFAGISEDSIIRLLLSVIPNDAEARQQALEAVRGVKHQSGVFAVVALAGFVFTGSNLVGSLELVLDTLYHAERRPMLRQRLLGVAMILLFSLVAVLGVGTSALLPLLDRLPYLPRPLTGPLAPLLQLAVGAVAGFTLFFVIYLVVPNRKLSVRQVWPGALVAGVAFEVLTLVFPLYVKLNGGINQYGKYFTFLLVLLTFFYFIGLITVIGAEVNAVLFPPAADVKSKPAADRVPEGPVASRRLARRAPALRRSETARRRGPFKHALLGVLAAAIGILTFSRRRQISS